MDRETLRLLLKEIDLKDNIVFRKVFCQALEILNLSDNEAAELIDISVPSIRRWKNGQLPHLVLRILTVREFEKLLNN